MLKREIFQASLATSGSIFAFITAERAGIFAGVCTGIWMMTQVGIAFYDRHKKRKSRKHHYPQCRNFDPS